MARSSIRVRPAVEADLPALVELGEELREQLVAGPEGARGRQPATGSRTQVAARYLEALADPERHLVVAVDLDDEPVGMALLTVTSANALLDLPAVHLSHAVVPDKHRRRGVGRALVAACAAYAEERGIDQVVVSVHPGSRDANRFFARLGFAPLAVRRVAPVSVVRRQLAARAESATEHVVHQLRRPIGRRSRAALAVRQARRDAADAG